MFSSLFLFASQNVGIAESEIAAEGQKRMKYFQEKFGIDLS